MNWTSLSMIQAALLGVKMRHHVFRLIVTSSFILPILFSTLNSHATAAPLCSELTQKIVLSQSDMEHGYQLRPNSPLLFDSQTPFNTRGRIDWYIDGILTQSDGNGSLCYNFPIAGKKIMEVRYADTGAYARFPLEIISYTGIRLKYALPNPIGTDTKSELLTLENTNPYAVTIDKWQLRSRRSKTTVPISGTFAPYGELSIILSNRLVNSEGEYDFVNESNVVIDTLLYDPPREGENLERNGIFWQGNTNRPEQITQDSPESKEMTSYIRGRVVKPNGRTVDLITEDGQPARIVVHPSYKKVRPRLHKGDTIEASGLWKRSSRGLYLSVREGHTLTLLYGATKNKAVQAKKTIKKQFVPVAAAAQFNTQSEEKVTKEIENTRVENRAIYTYEKNRWVIIILALIISSGILLSLPITRKNSV